MYNLNLIIRKQEVNLNEIILFKESNTALFKYVSVIKDKDRMRNLPN